MEQHFIVLFQVIIVLIGIFALTKIKTPFKYLLLIFFVFGLVILLQKYSRLQAQGEGPAASSQSSASQKPESPAQKFFQQGVELENAGQIDQAIEIFSKVIELEPNFFDGYNHRANSLAQKKEYEKALQDYQKAMDLNPQEATLYYNRAVVYYLMKKYPETLEDYNKAIELNPQYVKAYLNRGTLFAENRQWQQALNDRAKLIELEPDKAKWYAGRAAIYVFKKEFASAIKDFNKAIELDPQDASFLFFRGMVYLEMNEREKGLADLKAAESLSDEYAGITDKVAFYGQQQDKVQSLAPETVQAAEAVVPEVVPREREYLALLEKDPQNIDALLYLAGAYVSVGKGDTAAEYAEKALGIDPEKAVEKDAYMIAVMGYYYSGNIKKSYETLQKALALDPQNERALAMKETLEFTSKNYYDGHMPEKASFEGFSTMFELRQAIEKLGVGIIGRAGQPDQIVYRDNNIFLDPPDNWSKVRNARMPNGTYVILLYVEDKDNLFPSIAVTKDFLPPGVHTALEFSKYINKIMEQQTGGKLRIPEPRSLEVNGYQASYIEMSDKDGRAKTAWYQFLIGGAVFSFQYTNTQARFDEAKPDFENFVYSLKVEKGTSFPMADAP